MMLLMRAESFAGYGLRVRDGAVGLTHCTARESKLTKLSD